MVRNSPKTNAYALSLFTLELGVQHILIQEENKSWKISSGNTGNVQLALPHFESIPKLVDYYQRKKLPIKGCHREVYLK